MIHFHKNKEIYHDYLLLLSDFIPIFIHGIADGLIPDLGSPQQQSAFPGIFVFTVGCPSCHQPSLRRENWTACLPHKNGDVPLSALPQDTTNKLAVLFFTTSFSNAQRPARKLWIRFFKVFWYDSTRGINSRSTDCEADSLTSLPLCRLYIKITLLQKSCFC